LRTGYVFINLYFTVPAVCTCIESRKQNSNYMNLYDVIIVGGGAAGLNAAVVLGRCQRKVLLFDTGKQRNRHSQGIHNYLTRDGILPKYMINLAHKEIRKYGISFLKREIVYVSKQKSGVFLVKDNSGIIYHAKKLLMTTGLIDKLPALNGIKRFYGKSVFHCPYCDAWEIRNKKIGIYAKNKNGFELALSLCTWSKTIIFFTDGKKYLSQAELDILKQYKIPVITNAIEKLRGLGGMLKAIVMKNNRQYPCDALFFVNGYSQQSHLVEQLGCNIGKKKMIITNKFQQTNVSGVYVAGDADKDVHFVVIAAAEGAKAAVIINKELQKEERLNRISLLKYQRAKPGKVY
jgi:thioredoxin reductase